MNLIICIGNRGCMAFNSRRVSSDRLVTERILRVCDGKLWIAPYSSSLFSQEHPVCISEHFLDEASSTDWCFVENTDPTAYLANAEKLVLFHWNRSYPSDLRLSLAFLDAGWKLTEREDFPGNSHERITMEVYRQCREDGSYLR